MRVRFLGAAHTVTGSQFLLETERASVLIDCGMFQGSPNEAIRNRIPLAYDPAAIDAILLTHAHLDHCGLIPHVVNEGYRGPIWATAGTVELATLVLLDSGKLQEEFAKRGRRWELRHPEKAAAEEQQERTAYRAALDLAEQGERIQTNATHAPPVPPSQPQIGVQLAGLEQAGMSVGSFETGEHVPTTIEPALAIPAGPSAPGMPHAGPGAAIDPESALLAQPARLEIDLDEPLYTERDARRALGQFRAIDYGFDHEVAPGIRATFVDAGHILGSAIILIHALDQEGGPERLLVFSGDLGRTNTPIIRDPTTPTEADYIFVESTYGGREHEPQDEAVRLLVEAVRMVAEHDGVLLIPSFAIGRTQEVVWELDRLISSGQIPLLPLYLDSPMASRASDIYRNHRDYYDEETRHLLETHESPLDYPNQIVTTDVHDSQAIARAKRPYMIVASNGMLTGGRVVGHLRNLIDDPGAVLLFVGYQGVGTLGAHLQAGARTVMIDGQERQVRCQVRSISGFSAHADESELLDWLANFGRGKTPGSPGFPRRVFLVHGDPDAQEALLPKVRGLGFDATIPAWHEQFDLD